MLIGSLIITILKTEGTELNFFMKMKKKKLLKASVIIFSLFVIAIISNYYSLEKTKNACVEQDFLAINWTVSCK